MKKTVIFLVLIIAVAGFSFGQASNEIPVDPDFSVTIAGKSAGNISVTQLIGANLKTEKPNYYVEGFSVVYLLPNGDLTEKIAFGSEIPQNWNVWLSTLKTGQKLFFENILIRGDDGSIRKAPFMNFIIE